jgi:biopolymer transport protein ExbD
VLHPDWPPVIIAVVFVWAIVMLCLCVAVAIIYPFGWFTVPKPKYQRASSRRRPAEPDQLDDEISRYRWVSFLIMYFFWFMLAIAILAQVSLPVRFWNERFFDHKLTVTLEDRSPPFDATIPPITIGAGGEVVFLELRLPPEDRDLESLRIRLIAVRPSLIWREPIVIRPEPATEHQRIIEVLSAIRRAGIDESMLL